MRDPQSLRAAVDRAFERHDAGDLEGALEIYADVLEGPAGADPVTVESLFAARFDRALIAAERGDFGAAAQGFAAAARGLDPVDPDHRHEIAMAEVNRATALRLAGRPGEAAELCADLVDRYVDASDVPTREQVARAWVALAELHLERGDRDAAAATASAVMDHLADIEGNWADEQRRSARETLRAARPHERVEARR